MYLKVFNEKAVENEVQSTSYDMVDGKVLINRVINSRGH